MTTLYDYIINITNHKEDTAMHCTVIKECYVNEYNHANSSIIR